MDVFVYDKNFNLLDMIQSFNSFIWTERYSEPGDFELFLPATNHLLDILKVGNYIEIEESDETMIIETVITKHEKVNNIRYLTVQGRSLLSILDRRCFLGNITWNDENANPPAPNYTYTNQSIWNMLRMLLNTTIINPKEWRRWLTNQGSYTAPIADYCEHNGDKKKISNFQIVSVPDHPELDPNSKIRTNAVSELLLGFTFSSDTVYNVAKSIIDKRHLGMKILYQNGKFNFYVYDGYNKENSIIFSQFYDNISNVNTMHSIKGKMNVMFSPIAAPARQYNEETSKYEYFSYEDCAVMSKEEGQNEGLMLDLRERTTSHSGLDFFEGVEDLSHVKTILVGGDGAELVKTKATYYTRLKNEAKKKFTENKKSLEVLECDVSTTDKLYKPKKDYNLGDIITVVDSYTNISKKMRVSELIYSYNTEGYKVYPSFVEFEEDDKDQT